MHSLRRYRRLDRKMALGAGHGGGGTYCGRGRGATLHDWGQELSDRRRSRARCRGGATVWILLTLTTALDYPTSTRLRGREGSGPVQRAMKVVLVVRRFAHDRRAKGAFCRPQRPEGKILCRPVGVSGRQRSEPGGETSPSGSPGALSCSTRNWGSRPGHSADFAAADLREPRL